ncbi:hypothetical protein [Nocardioides deserti]|uniref:Uncharacterized protein n=1 Tax=Nocardioides deserti TaxID=1588644 RepID=A0ABR6UAA1_9ACTN|nr:hypothetical protein [Nocardioides deserti]MBC2961288.1 hypothetical protein [Nocardioides deserti]GGO72305.1 hypothetical protein GCM10012276_15330 [Nocardioides deserti]
MSGEGGKPGFPEEVPVDEDLSEPLRASNPNANGPDGAAGGMGVSSERVGHAGPAQTSTDGVRDNSLAEAGDHGDADAVPEQSVGGPEDNPDGVAPRAGYPSKDPRSKEHPFDAKPDL